MAGSGGLRAGIAIWLVSLFALAPACGKRREQPPTGEPEPATEPAIEPAIAISSRTILAEGDVFEGARLEHPVFDELELLDPGKSPRRELRYRPGEMGPRSLVVTTHTSRREIIDRQLGQTVVLPEVRYGLAFSSVSPGEGSVTLHFRGLAVEAGEAAGDQARALGAAQIELLGRALSRRRGSVTLSPRGRLGDVALVADEPGDVDRAGEEITRLLIQSVVPLPAEPVGAGARWRQTIRFQRGAHVVKQVAELKLEEIDGDRLQLDARIRQVGEPQWVDPRYLPEGVTGELILFLWRARGKIAVDLGLPTPAAADLEVELKTHGRLRDSRRSQELYAEETGTLLLRTD